MIRPLPPFLLAFSLLMAGCDSKEPEDTGTPPVDDDVDDDGFAAGDDCDDTNADVHPGATERCNGLDDDCDDAIDEDVTPTWYADADGDGFGDPAVSQAACDPPSGSVSNADDCDDDVPTVSPAATEQCDGRDNDCDGVIDEDDASNATTWYTDADRDGHGDPSSSTRSCLQPPDTSSQGDDCDDTDPDRRPSADEICNSVDDDCDGETDEGDAVDANPWYADADADGWGDPDAPTTACTQPAGHVATAGDCDDDDAAIHPDADELCNHVDDDCDDETDEDDALDASTFYLDFDADGWGSTYVTTTACEAPGGYAAEAGDCADTDADVHPGVTETCNGKDDDCDGTVDVGATGTATWWADADGDSYGDPASPLESCAAPPGYTTNTEDCDDAAAWSNPTAAERCSDSADNDCDGDVDEGCPLEHCGTITADETWSAADGHTVTCDVHVDGATLTIEDGVRVTFAAGTGLYVGWDAPATLDVRGSTAGVAFTAEPSGASPGHWTGVALGSLDAGSVLQGLLLELAGGTGWGGLMISSGAAPTMDHCTLRMNDAAGVYNLGSPTVTSSAFDENLGPGWDGGSGTLTSFTGNSFTGNKGPALVVAPADVSSVDSSTRLSGNDADVVGVASGTLTASDTWLALPYPYRIQGPLSIGGPAAPRLVLADGVRVEFDEGAGLWVGDGVAGSLEVNGPGMGVTLTSAQATPAPGDWVGLTFGSDDQSSTLLGATVEYAGADGDAAMIVAVPTGSTVTLERCAVTASAADGLQLASGAADVEASTFEDNAGDGIWVDASADLTFSGGVCTGNGGFPLDLPATLVGRLDTSSTFSGNVEDAVRVRGATLDTSVSWEDLGVPYRVAEMVTVQGAARPTLTLEAGTEVRFEEDGGLNVAYSTWGALLVAGTAGSPVLLTSAQDPPAPGDWQGIYLGNWCDAAATRFEQMVVEYGGGNGYGNLVFVACNGSVTDAGVYHSGRYGIYRSLATPTLTRVTYSGNVVGDLF